MHGVSAAVVLATAMYQIDNCVCLVVKSIPKTRPIVFIQAELGVRKSSFLTELSLHLQYVETAHYI